MLDEPKYWVSLILGLIVTALGVIPLLQLWGIIDFTLPGFLLFSWDILLWITAAVGAYLLIDSFISEQDTLMWVSVVVAVLILAITVIQILNNMGIVGFAVPLLNLTVLRVLFTIEGIGLIIAGILGDK